LALGIAQGMYHLHENKIIHRDLAARNILLHHGESKISDFGMSRSLNQQNEGKTKSMIGPIRWMAPESLGEQLYSSKSDIWTYGIVLYEIVARKEPHEKEVQLLIGAKIRDEGLTPEIPNDNDDGDDCPKCLKEVMEMCWKKDPTQRPEFDTICKFLLEAEKTSN